jgi:hypothetical protein
MEISLGLLNILVNSEASVDRRLSQMKESRSKNECTSEHERAGEKERASK